jgi:glycosyltransferase involved in cell wall biosynthesis
MPRVSVIIPTFNCARFLGRAIDSALAQTYGDYEVIVVDDGSTDETQHVVPRFGGKIRYLYQPNKGVSSARNLALSQASGELIAYLDADDMWYPHKLERQVAFLDTHRECGLVHSDFAVIDEMDRAIHHQVYRETQRKVPQGYCTLELLRTCHMQTSTVVERRECMERTDNFDARLPVCQDYLRWIIVAMEGFAFGYIDEALALYRWRTDSLFHSSPTRASEDVRTICNILLNEKSLATRFGREAADIIREHLYTVGRELAYAYRIDGRPGRSMRELIRLIWKWPFRIDPYVDLLKACVPAPLATSLRMVKAKFS